MADRVQFDNALIDELARCFVEAAVERMLAGESVEEIKDVKPLPCKEKRSRRTKPGLALSTIRESGATIEPSSNDWNPDDAPALRTIREVR